MPLHDFSCRLCAARYEELVRPGELAPCPECGSTDVERLISPFAPPPRLGLRGGDARRSEARRRDARERRRERRGKG